MKDTDWAELLEKSPQTAQRQLISEYSGLVYAIVINKLKAIASREEIEDCISDIFVEIFKSTDKFADSSGSMKSYISSIAKHRAIDESRKLSYRRNITVSAEDENVFLPPEKERPDELIEDKLFKKRLWEIIKELGEPDSTIIIYRYFYDMKAHEVADKLNMTAEAVQKRTSRARQRMKTILTKEELL